MYCFNYTDNCNIIFEALDISPRLKIHVTTSRIHNIAILQTRVKNYCYICASSDQKLVNLQDLLKALKLFII